MIVSIHQPHFLAWLGYWDRMRQSDLFVLLDHVQFERQNYQNRVMIKTGHGPQWLIVPVHQRSRSESILEKRIDNQGHGRHHWARRVVLTLEHAYRGAPFFEPWGAQLRELLLRPWENLIDLNLALIEWLRAALDIQTPMVRSSQLGVTGAKSELVLSICRAAGASVFLGGLGASREYVDPESFRRAGIGLSWQSFRHPRYPQHPAPQQFVEGLSALDLLFNCGPRSAEILSQPGPARRAPVRERHGTAVFAPEASAAAAGPARRANRAGVGT
jgi:hypothetical protein